MFGLLLLQVVIEGLGMGSRPPEIDCRGSRRNEVCTDQGRAELLAELNLQSIETETARGAEIYRAFYLTGGGGLPAVVFVRRPGHHPQLEIAGGGGVTFRADVPMAVWNDIRVEAESADRVLTPRPGENDDYCMEGGAVLAEIGRPGYGSREPAVVRRRAESACGSGMTNRFARRLAERAVALLPGCEAIDPDRTPDAGIWRIHYCSRLSGDQFAAAAVFNRFDGEPNQGATEAEWTRATGVDGRTRLSWDGEAVTGDPRTFLVQRATPQANLRLTVRSVRGVSARDVIVDGHAEYSEDGRGYIAEFTQVWVLPPYGSEWRVSEWTVQPFTAWPAPE